MAMILDGFVLLEDYMSGVSDTESDGNLDESDREASGEGIPVDEPFPVSQSDSSSQEPGSLVQEPDKLLPADGNSTEAEKKLVTPLNKSLDDDGQTCTICFEPWTNSSEHRLVSLRCGHLYGRSCISRWLKGQNARCPQCNSRARKSEIRNIYARTIKVLDTSERDKAVKALEKECELRRKSEIEATQERLKCAMALQECERLKIELMEAKQLLIEARLGNKYSESYSQSAKGSTSLFCLEKTVEISKLGGCRIFDVCGLLGMIVVSQPSGNDLFHGYGFRRISTTDMKPAEFVLIHQKQIKDMSFHIHDGLVLTASLDRTVKLTSVLTNSVVQTYNLDSDAWSCSWDSDDPIYFYAGEKSGGVFLFDIRVTGRHVHELPRLGANAPVVALQYLKKTGAASKCGPLFGKLSSCGFYEKIHNSNSYRGDTLPLTGLFTSLSSEPTTGHFLISSRPSCKQPRVTHTLCEFENAEGFPYFHPIQTIQGGSNQVQLTRSKLLPHPDKDSSLLVCAGDEDAHGALIWDGSSGTCLSTLKTDSPVLDITGLKINHKTHIACLTDKSLRLYSWTG